MVSLIRESSYISGLLDKPEKTVHKLLEKIVWCRGEINANLTRDNDGIRELFDTYKDTLFKSHISNTRSLMWSGAAHFSGTETIVVVGPGLIEPLKKLEKQCKKLILIDYDQRSLALIASQLDTRKVHIIPADLSGGLCEAAQAFIEKTKQNMSKEKITKHLEELCTFYITFIPKSNSINIEADYVISSLVCDQLFRKVHDAVAQFFEGVLDVPLQRDRQMDEHNILAYKTASYKLQRKLNEMHIRDLQAWVKPQGSIFFADTVSLRMMYPMTRECSYYPTPIWDTNMLLAEGLLEEVEQYFTINKKEKWTWLSDPNSKVGFDVQAYIMQRKSPNLFNCPPSKTAERGMKEIIEKAKKLTLKE